MSTLSLKKIFIELVIQLLIVKLSIKIMSFQYGSYFFFIKLRFKMILLC